jgi:preprotein translocase subunit SecF
MKLLKLVPDNTNFKFLRLKWWALAFSVALVVGSLALTAIRGLNFGIDFTGGIMIEAGFDQAPDLDALRGQVNGLGLGDASLQNFGSPTEIAIRLPRQGDGNEKLTQAAVAKVQASLKANFKDGVTFRRVETVGGKVSAELFRDAALAMTLAMIGIALYIWIRFEWQFGVGALLSLIHDVAITLGFFAITQMEVNLSIVAAFLTIIGYSLNDTVVVYDRIRENLKKHRKMDIEQLLDLSVNETLSRTIMTSLCMALSLLALILFGGEVIRGFTAAMLLGVAIGTYSSIYIAAPMLIWMKVNANSFIPQATGPAEKIAP